MAERICQHCLKNFLGKRSEGRKFCSRQCYSDYLRGNSFGAAKVGPFYGKTICGHLPHKGKGYCRKCYQRLFGRTAQQRREAHLRKNFGITSKEYAELAKKYKQGCWICGFTPKRSQRRLAVDHDHKTGRVRGLLCWNCNQGLGKFKDNVAYLLRAISYLKGEL